MYTDRVLPPLVPLRALAVVASLFLASGCSEEASPSPAPDAGPQPASATSGRDAATTAPAARGALDPSPRNLFGKRTPPLRAQELELAERADPAKDDFESEKWHARAEPVLAAFVQALAGAPQVDTAGLEATLDPSFAGLRAFATEDLVPAEDDGGLRIARAATCERRYTREELGEAAAAIRAGAAGPARVELRSVGLERLDDGWATTVQVQLDAAGVQVNEDWRVTWSDGPRVRAVDVVRHEEVHAAGPLFEEVTHAALGANEFWAEEMDRGVADYFMRIDRLAGFSFQGMHGLAVGDVNGDGLDDLYVCQQVGLPNRLLVRNPDGTATDRAPELFLDYLDLTRAALIVDMNSDGRQDLVLAVANEVVIAYQGKTQRFDRRLSLTAPGSEQIYTLCAGDVTGDGRLDLFAGRYALGGVMHGFPTPYHDAENGALNVLWVRDGARFVDASEPAGLTAVSSRFTLGSLMVDYDDDGDLDLYVVNDFGRNNLFKNDGTGRFEEVAVAVGAEDMAAGMGASAADYDLDGDIDLYVTNMFAASGLRIASQPEFMDGRDPDIHRHYVRHARGNTLLENRGDGTFEDVTEEAGVAMGRWGWGGKFLDFQNDGREDLYIPNGSTTSAEDEEDDLENFFWRGVIARSPRGGTPTESYKTAFTTIHNLVMYEQRTWNGRERNCAYVNLGDGSFANVSGASGADFPDDARAAAVLDWNDDGLADLVLRNRNAPRLRVLLNRNPAPGRFLALDLVGPEGSNRDAIGARVDVEVGGQRYSKRLFAGDGYLAQSSKRLLFGLGSAQGEASATVRWPDGSTQSFEGLALDARHRLVHGSAAAEPVAAHARIQLAADTEAAPAPSPVRRMVLANKLPLGPLELPGFEDSARTFDSLDQEALIVFGSALHQGSVEEIERLAARRDELAAAGLTLVPMVIDEGRDLARARALLGELGLLDRAGYADGSLRRTLEGVMLEVLGFYDRIPLPSALHVDSKGQLAVAWLGPVDVDALLRDQRVLHELKTWNPLTVKLSGGTWKRPRVRDLRLFGQGLAQQGRSDLATFYMEFEWPAPPARNR